MVLAERLRRAEALLEAYNLLGSSLELGDVLRRTLEAATRLTGAERGSITLLNPEGTHLVFAATTDHDEERLRELTVPLGSGVCGWVAASGESVLIDDVRHDPRFFAGVDQALGQATTSYLCVPLSVEGRLVGTAQVMNRVDRNGFTRADQELMEGFARQAAQAIVNARLVELRLKERRLQAELEVCGAIQRQLFPRQPPALAGFEVYGACVPCGEVGGDFYTWVERPDGSCDLILADVSGKGLPAALMVSDLHAATALLAPTDLSLADLATALNHHFRRVLLGNKFITLVAFRVCPGAAELTQVVAGHPAPLMVTADGSVQPLRSPGPVLGMIPASYVSRQVELSPGDLVVAYSDGYSEAENPAGDELGEAGIAAALAHWRDLPLAEIASRLDAVASAHRAGAPAADDATLLLLRRSVG